jgi:hypothetical protein
MARMEYYAFWGEIEPPRSRWWQNIRVIEDLDDAWQRWIARVAPESFTSPDAAELVDLFVNRGHPGLGIAASTLVGQRLSLSPSRPSVQLRPLTRRHRRRLTRRARHIPRNVGVRWFTFERAPSDWWSDRAKDEADSARQDATTVLGREPVDDYEVAHVLVNRNDEFLAACSARLGVEPEPEPEGTATIDPSDYQPPPILCALVEDVLLRKGWRLEHPAIRGVLIGPDGERVDAIQSVTMTDTGFDLEPLRVVLRPGRPAGVEVL